MAMAPIWPHPIKCSTIKEAKPQEGAEGLISAGREWTLPRQDRQSIMTTHLLPETEAKPDVTKAEALAKATLAEVGITQPPVNPITVAKRLGYSVNAAKFASSNISGRCQKSNGTIRIDVSAYDAPSRRNFTIAHEIGHALLHLAGIDDATISDPEYRWAVPDEQNPYKEAEANRFAAALLMPPDWVATRFEQDQDPGSLARFFGVSRDAMKIQLERIGLIAK